VGNLRAHYTATPTEVVAAAGVRRLYVNCDDR